MAELLKQEEIAGSVGDIRKLFNAYEPHFRDRFICDVKSVEKDEAGNHLYGLPSYAVQGITNITTKDTTHTMDIHYYIPIVPNTEKMAYEFYANVDDFIVEIKDLGPVGDVVSHKVYSNCRINRIYRSPYNYTVRRDLGDSMKEGSETFYSILDSAASTLVLSITSDILEFNF